MGLGLVITSIVHLHLHLRLWVCGGFSEPLQWQPQQLGSLNSLAGRCRRARSGNGVQEGEHAWIEDGWGFC